MIVDLDGCPVADTVRRTHHSKCVVRAIRATEPRAIHDGMKPAGLWYSIDGDWERWCQDSDPNFLAPVGHDIVLADETILRLSSKREIQKFQREYGSRIGRLLHIIDWQAVGQHYDGIEIAPYCWPARLEVLWYYSWDCASGCLWRPRGATITPLKEHAG